MKKTFWIASYFDGDNDNWLIFASNAGNQGQAEDTFKQCYKNNYDCEIDNADIIQIDEIKTVCDDEKEYKLLLSAV